MREGVRLGYMRVSKADGSQVLDLQHDALLQAGVEERHLAMTGRAWSTA
jgi:hypothetical protein